MVWSNPSPTLVAPEELEGVSVFAVVTPAVTSVIEAFGFETVAGEILDVEQYGTRTPRPFMRARRPRT